MALIATDGANDNTVVRNIQRLNLEKTSGTIAFIGGILAYTSSFIEVNGNGGGADDLNTIGVGIGLEDGDILVLKKLAASGAITVKDGAGNVNLAGGDMVLDDEDDKLMLIYDLTPNSDWTELSRSDNA